KLDDRVHERKLWNRHPWLVVDGERVDRGTARRRLVRDVLGVAHRADHRRGMKPVPALLTTMEPQDTVTPGRPITAVSVGQTREDPKGRFAHTGTRNSPLTNQRARRPVWRTPRRSAGT